MDVRELRELEGGAAALGAAGDRDEPVADARFAEDDLEAAPRAGYDRLAAAVGRQSDPFPRLEGPAGNGHRIDADELQAGAACRRRAALRGGQCRGRDDQQEAAELGVPSGSRFYVAAPYTVT